ncbi:MAG TPA: TonB family protein [Acidobacteriaceae bacterium]|nr:TonB family protein [Acidobacteriaceae bacterium]
MRRPVIQVEPEPFGPPAAGSVVLHVGLVGLMALLMWVNGRFHGTEWGNNAPPGAIQANLVSSAPSIPLPQVAPPTPNVLATQLPSPSPAPPTKATIPVQEPDAIPLAERKPKLKAAEKPHEESPKHAQPTNQQNRANYGEAAPSQLAHAMNQGRNNSPVAVTGGDFASRFPWYVDLITRKVSESWYTQEIDSHTPYGSQVSVTFTIARDGTVSNIHLVQASNSPTLNGSATRAVQRVQTFGPLPSQYTGSSVSVEYTFTYDQPSR